MQAISALTLEEGVLLGHALVAGIAERVGGRVLFIKGPSFAQMGLRPLRGSVDIDALVHPHDVTAVRAALRSAGWDARVPDTTAHALPFHSVPLACEGWPCEIDLHRHFPGFFAGPADVFDALWERRGLLVVADRAVPVCDLLGGVLVSALHSERSRHHKQHELDFLVDTVRQRLGVEELHELAELAARTGCADTLRDFLDRVGAPPVGAGTTRPEDLHEWAVETGAEGTHGVFWLHELGRTPLRRLPQTLWHAVMFTEPELRSLFPEARPGRLGLWQARWWRLQRAVRQLPRAIHLLRTADRRRGLD